jgi:hypothetical protein
MPLSLDEHVLLPSLCDQQWSYLRRILERMFQGIDYSSLMMRPHGMAVSRRERYHQRTSSETVSQFLR